MTLGEQIAAAVSRGLSFVLAAQDAEGAWTDWALPPGPSADWTTAHVGLRLSGLGPSHRGPLAEPLGRAARWLLYRQTAAGGWGYNQAVEPDADTTAQALLFLAAAGQSAPSKACAFLARHQQPDGGFATFLPDPLIGSWGLSHPEVTPAALLALRAHPGGLPADSLARGLTWLRRARRPDGLWNSFWWSTPIPATEVNLALLAALGTPEPLPPALARWTPTDSLETALLLSVTAAAGSSPRLEQLVQRLLADQRDDGSWMSAPRLRITARACERPWDAAESSPLFADPQRLHGTVTALAALSTAQRTLAVGL
jgi:Prenyltransferase and squalene oxidase repeat